MEFRFDKFLLHKNQFLHLAEKWGYLALKKDDIKKDV